MKKFFACCSLLVFSAVSFGQVSVTGDGVVPGKPNVASFKVTVTTNASKLETALEANNKSMSMVRNAACGFEVNMTTRGFNIWSSKNKEEVVSYYVSNSLSVNCKIDDLSKVLQSTIVDDNCSVNSLSFGFTKMKKDYLLKKARRAAVEDALAKAKVYADSAGVSLGKVLSIEERYTRTPVVEGDYARFKGVPISPGVTTINVQVFVRFDLN